MVLDDPVLKVAPPPGDEPFVAIILLRQTKQPPTRIISCWGDLIAFSYSSHTNTQSFHIGWLLEMTIKPIDLSCYVIVSLPILMTSDTSVFLLTDLPPSLSTTYLPPHLFLNSEF